MKDGTPFSEVGLNGCNPDEARTMTDGASLSFVRPREGDSKSPPGREDSPTATSDPVPDLSRPAGRTWTGTRLRVDGTGPAGLPLLSVVARVALAVAAREIATETAAVTTATTQVANPLAIPTIPSNSRAPSVDAAGRVA